MSYGTQFYWVNNLLGETGNNRKVHLQLWISTQIVGITIIDGGATDIACVVQWIERSVGAARDF